MSNIENSPEIVTLDTLKLFKAQLLESIGIKLGNTNSIIQASNEEVYKVANSAFIGEAHKTPLPVDGIRKGLKNVLVSGQGNTANAWNQTVLGTFNKPEENALFIIGNGTSELLQNNIIEVHKNGSVLVHDVKIQADTPNTLNISGKLAYDSTRLDSEVAVKDHWQNFCKFIEQLPNNEIITVDFLKTLCKEVDTLNGIFSTNSDDELYNMATTWRNTLVQQLYKKQDGEESNPYADISFSEEELNKLNNIEDAHKYALSLYDGLYLYKLIQKNKDDANIIELHNKIELLKRQISYLISCLTVDKIVKDETEYYAVGIANYALDKDTKFIIYSNDELDANTEIDLDKGESNDGK
jgi:hypothetical protein